MTGDPVGDSAELTPFARQVRRRSKIWSAGGGKFGLLLLALIGLMAATPLIISGPVWNAFLNLFTGCVMVAGLHAARPGDRPVLVGIGLAALDFAVGRLVGWFDARPIILLQCVLWLATLVYVTVTILELIFESEEVTTETLQASLCVYLLFGLMGAFGYSVIELLLPGSFRGAEGAAVVWTDPGSRALLFMRLFTLSYATLAGSSPGDIAPASAFACNAQALQAMAGQIYLAVVIARLVGLQSIPPPPRPAAGETTGGNGGRDGG